MKGECEMVVADREGMLAYAEGILLKNINGKVVIGDDIRILKAIDAMENGEEILLTENDRVVSKMRIINGIYTEIKE